MLWGVEHVQRHQRPVRVIGHGLQEPSQPYGQPVDVGRVEHLGVEFDTQAEFIARHGLQRQRVVVVFVAAELGGGQLTGGRQGGGVDGIVLVHQQAVEQLVVPGDAVNLVERQVLVLEGVIVGALQLPQQFGDGGGRGDAGAHRHGVDQQTDHGFRAGQIGWPARDGGAEGDVALAGLPHQQLRPRALQHGVEGGAAGTREFA
ncbi:hypothetical protein MUNTM_53800 [Mycobacterium sp. MUNTM1]